MTYHVSNNWHYNVNEYFASHAAGYVVWIDTFLSAGWTAVQSSDGSAVTASVVPDATDWGNNNAWVHLRDPGGGRDLAIQRGTTGHSTAVYLGRAGEPFTGGSATVVPSAAGSFQLVGTGGGTASNFFGSSTISNYRYHFGAGATPGGTSGDVYPFWFLSIGTNSINSPQGALLLAPVIGTADGTVGDADSEPWISNASPGSFSGLRGWYKAGLTGAVQDTNLSVTELTSWTGRNPYTGLDDLSPLFAFSITGGREQRKGILEHFYGDSSLRASYQTMSLAVEGKSRINVNAFSFPWPHNVPFEY